MTQGPSTTPVASVVLLTYDHERYLAQAVEGVLGQRADFGVELLLTEDRSTDRTREIALDYAARHPGRVRLFLSERNLNTNEVTARAIRAARGEFVAFLDGDDFWTSPDKLRLQVAYLDAHPECAMCFHDVQVVTDDGAVEPETYTGDSVPEQTGIPEILERCFVAGCSPLIRRSAIADLPEWFEHAPVGDWPLYVLAAEHGRVGYLSQVLGAYRRHGGGYWSGASRAVQMRRTVDFYEMIRTHVGPSHGGHLRDLLARRLCDLGMSQEALGDIAGAAASMARSVRESPVGRGIPLGRRSRRLARYFGLALLGRGLTLPVLLGAVGADSHASKGG